MRMRRHCLFSALVGLISAFLALATSEADEITRNRDSSLSIRDAVVMAERIYEPSKTELPRCVSLLKAVEAPDSGLYAEIYEAARDGLSPSDRHLIVAIRGVEFGKLWKDHAAFSADVRSAAAGGVPQWRDLEAPLMNALREHRATHVTLVGHSMGGMISQLAVGKLIQDQPKLKVTAIMFNSPGVSALIQSNTPARLKADETNLQLIHLVHHADSIPRITNFGEHLSGTRWHMVRNQSPTPHSLKNFMDYLDTHDGLLPKPLSAGEVHSYMLPPQPTDVGAVESTDGLRGERVAATSQSSKEE